MVVLVIISLPGEFWIWEHGGTIYRPITFKGSDGFSDQTPRRLCFGTWVCRYIGRYLCIYIYIYGSMLLSIHGAMLIPHVFNSVQLEQYFGVPHCDVCMYVCMYVCIYLCMYLCLCVCVRMYVSMHACMCEARFFALVAYIYIYIPFERAKSLKTWIQGEKTSCRNMCVSV